MFCRNLRDFVPSHPKHYKLNNKWVNLAYQRELQLQKQNEQLSKSYNKHAHPLKPLQLGTNVLVQNKHDKRHFINIWNLSGHIVEVLQHRQYKVRMDGSGRVSLRNRKHIKVVPKGVNNCDSPHFKPALKLSIQNKVPRIPSIDNNPVSNNIVSHDNITSHNNSLRNNNVTPDNEIFHSAQKRRFTSAMKKLADYNAPGRREQPLAATRRHAQPP